MIMMTVSMMIIVFVFVCVTLVAFVMFFVLVVTSFPFAIRRWPVICRRSLVVHRMFACPSYGGPHS